MTVASWAVKTDFFNEFLIISCVVSFDFISSQHKEAKNQILFVKMKCSHALNKGFCGFKAG